MKLPQDKILHIDTEFKDGKVNLVTEWQGELVRCKDCRHAYFDCLYPVCNLLDMNIGDDDFCSWGERKGGENE